MAESILYRTRKDGLCCHPQIGDIPKVVLYSFQDVYTPCILELTGSLPAWESPSEEDLENIWNKVYDRVTAVESKLLEHAVSFLFKWLSHNLLAIASGIIQWHVN